MASVKEMHTKDGKLFYKITVSVSHNQQFSTRFYPEKTWSKKVIERKLAAFAADFENRCKAGLVENRKTRKEKAHQEELERAKIKTFSQYYTDVFSPTKKIVLSKKTYSDYCSYFRLHILPYFADFTLSEITPRMITARLLEFGETHKHNSTIKLYVILSTFFDMALMDDTIEINPMQKVKRPKQQKEEKLNNGSTVKSLSLDELKHVLKCLELEPLKWQTYIYLLFDTGCRRSELLALNWGDVNFDTGILQINKSIGYTPENGEYITTPKNGKSRTVDIGEKSLSLLKALHKAQLNNGILSQWVFTQDGCAERMFYNSPTGYFDSFGKRYGVENFHPHILRHTSATLSILNGADVTSVAARLGHSDVSTTLRFYAHANQESIKKVGDTVRNLIAETS